MDTRLINQVVEWEWRIQIENEKKNSHNSDTYNNFLIALEYCGKLIKTKLQYFINVSRNRILSIHNTEPAKLLDHQ